VSIIVANLAPTLASPIDFVLDTNAVVFVGMFTVLAGLALPAIAIRAGSRRKQNQPQPPRRSTKDTEYSREMRFISAPTAQDQPLPQTEFAILRPDQHGINRVSTNAGTHEIFHVGPAHQFTPGDTK